MYLYADKITPYQVTEEDVLWFLRAVDAEGAIESEVAATLINGFCFTRSQGHKWTLTEFVRAYAQPVNPRWYIEGDLFLKSLETMPPNRWAYARQVALNREHILSVSRSFSSVAERAVVAALSGLVKIPKNATDYAAAWVDAHKKEQVPLFAAVAGRNRLWYRKGAATWKGYTVEPLQVPAWLKTLKSVNLERAFDRNFSTELSKISDFYAQNTETYTNKKKQIAFGEIRLNVGEAANYATNYGAAIVEQAANEKITGFARGEEMQRSTRKEIFKAAEAHNETNVDQWDMRVAKFRQLMGAATPPLVVHNALGFDFNTGTWTMAVATPTAPQTPTETLESTDGQKV